MSITQCPGEELQVGKSVLISAPWREHQGDHISWKYTTATGSTPHTKAVKNSPHGAGWEGKRSRQVRTEPLGGPQTRGGTGTWRPSLERPVNATHWAPQPWDDPGRWQPCSCCEPRGTHRRPRNLTHLLKHAPTPAPGTDWRGHQTLSRTRPVYWAVSVTPSPQMPPQCLWIQFTPPGARAAHAGQSRQWGYRVSSDQQDIWTGQGGHRLWEGIKKQGSGNILLHFLHSKVL